MRLGAHRAGLPSTRRDRDQDERRSLQFCDKSAKVSFLSGRSTSQEWILARSSVLIKREGFRKDTRQSIGELHIDSARICVSRTGVALRRGVECSQNGDPSRESDVLELGHGRLSIGVGGSLSIVIHSGCVGRRRARRVVLVSIRTIRSREIVCARQARAIV